jgi:DNA polymerase-3 subunit epsilon
MSNMNNTAAGNPAGGGEIVSGADRYKILRPARERSEWPPVPPEQADGMRQICVIDVETTGLDWRRHVLIEICAARVQIDRHGRIAGVRSIGTGLEDPGQPLPTEIARLTGLSDDLLAGKSIARDALAETIASCSGVVAFNSAFDRSWVEKLLPDLPSLSWGCAMKDVPWRALGLQPGPQNYLLQQCGFYPSAAHRAEADVLSLCQLLDYVFDDGQSVMAKLLCAMTAPAFRFEATRAPYDKRHDLKDRGYLFRQQGLGAVWHKHVRADEYDDELAWYRTTIGMEPSIVDLPATERYRDECTWTPVVPQGGWPKYLK